MKTIIRPYRPVRKFSLGDKDNIAVRLVLINLVIFAGLTFTKIVYTITLAPAEAFTSQVIPWAVLSADPIHFFTHPWTLFTYMFVHTNFWVFLGSVVWLWAYGELLQGIYGTRFIVPLYVYGGLAGAIFFIASFQLVPELHQQIQAANSIYIGASASVMALVICTTILEPKYRIFPSLGGGIPLYAVTIVYLLLSFLGHGGLLAPGYFFALAGGLLLGGYFGLRIKKGYEPGSYLNQLIFKFSHVFDPKEVVTEQRIRDSFFGREDSSEVPPYQRVGPISDSRVDELLDKISTSGYQSLTSEEKEILIRASKEKNEL